MIQPERIFSEKKTDVLDKASSWLNFNQMKMNILKFRNTFFSSTLPLLEEVLE